MKELTELAPDNPESSEYQALDYERDIEKNAIMRERNRCIGIVNKYFKNSKGIYMEDNRDEAIREIKQCTVLKDVPTIATGNTKEIKGEYQAQRIADLEEIKEKHGAGCDWIDVIQAKIKSIREGSDI